MKEAMRELLMNLGGAFFCFVATESLSKGTALYCAIRMLQECRRGFLSIHNRDTTPLEKKEGE